MRLKLFADHHNDVIHAALYVLLASTERLTIDDKRHMESCVSRWRQEHESGLTGRNDADENVRAAHIRSHVP